MDDTVSFAPVSVTPANNRKSSSSGKGAKIAAISAAAVVMLALAGTAAAAMYVKNIDTVYPNVSICDVDVGGLSLQQAASKIAASGTVGYDDSAAVTVQFPDGYALTLSAAECSSGNAAGDAAIKAYEYGRDGNLFGNLLSYIKCSISDTSLSSDSAIRLDENYIRSRIASAAADVNSDLAGSELTVSDDAILVTKGTSAVLVDTDAVYRLVEDAFLSRNMSVIPYEPQISADTQLDLDSLYDSIFCEAKDAEYDPLTHEATQSVTGISFDRDAAQKLWDAAAIGEQVRIELVRTEPETTTESLNALLFADVLAEKTTYLTYESNRNNNINRAAQSIDGTILNPGEEFSYNTALGKRTLENGYLGAGAYSNGEVVTEIGGGICQVSSTLYYCALLSNLKITDRTCHYFLVSYLPTGLDATVSWGGPDFKFVNDRDYPVMISASADLTARTVTVKILGTDVDGSYVKMETSSWETAFGWEATSYRVLYDAAGNVIKRSKEAGSKYHRHEDPSPSPSEEPSPSPSVEPSPSAEVSAPPTDLPAETPAETAPVSGEVTPAPTETASADPTPAPTPEPEVPEPTEPVGE